MDDAEKEALQRIVQLVVLCIPLFTLPLILKSSNSLLGKIANNADRVTKAIGVEKGLTAAQGGMKKRAATYGRFGAGVGMNAVGGATRPLRRRVRSSNFAQNTLRLGDPDDPSALARGAAKLKPSNIRAIDRAVGMAVEAKKAQKNEAINELAFKAITQSGKNLDDGGKKSILLGNMARVGGTSLVSQAGAQAEKAEKERVAGIYATFKLNDTNWDTLETALVRAMKSGDHSTATAAINRLTEMGATGVAKAANAIESTPLAGSENEEMRKTINKAINDGSNYGAFLGKDAGMVKGGGYNEATGQFERKGLGGVSAEQLAGQTESSLARHYDTMSAQQASEIMANDTLRSKITSDKAREIIEAKAAGAATSPHAYTPLPPPTP